MKSKKPRAGPGEDAVFPPLPYIHLHSGGEKEKEKAGCSAVFALELESCPTGRLRAGEDPERSLATRLKAQADFINGLHNPDAQCTFAVRYISQPNRTSPLAGRIRICLLVKVQGRSGDEARYGSELLFNETAALLGGMLPNYTWRIVKSRSDFLSLWAPFDRENASIVGIRRREELARLGTVRPRPMLGRDRVQSEPGVRDEDAVYLIHRFIPRTTSLGRLLRLLLLYPVPVVWQTTLRPSWLAPEEERLFIDEIAKCEQYQAVSNDRALSPIENLQQSRARAICQSLVRQLHAIQDAPFQMTVALASPSPLARTLVEAVGIEMTCPVAFDDGGEGFQLSGGYDVVYPADAHDLESAQASVWELQTETWGSRLTEDERSRFLYLVDASEAVSAFRLPVPDPEGLAGVETNALRALPVPPLVAGMADAPPEERLFIGENHYLGFAQKVFLSQSDRRQHTYVVGQTGTGKTTLIKSMILGDMWTGRGVGVIDPHGDLFEELLRNIPPRRLHDVVIVDPSDTDFPVGFNMLECADEQARHFIARQLRSIMERLIADQYGGSAPQFAGPAFFQHMQNNALLAMSNPSDPGTLLEFYQIYQDRRYWRKWIPLRWQDPILKSWAEVTLDKIDYTARTSEGLTWGEYLSSKFVDFVFDPKLRLMFGQKHSTIDLFDILQEGRILLVNLSKGRLAEANSRFLGMLLLAGLYAAALKRTHIPEQERRPFHLYVDEFQSLATESFTLLMTEARKFGLSLVLANQFLSQVADARIVSGILGNARTIACFRVSHADGQLMEPLYKPYFDCLDLVNLPNWNACLRTSIGGQVTAPFTLRTVPIDEGQDGTAEKARAFSRERYGRPRSQVEAEIAASFASPKGD